MSHGRLIVLTRTEGTEGFLAILWELMWHANFSYLPEYLVYARSLGLGLDDCVTKLILHPQHVEGESERLLKY